MMRAPGGIDFGLGEQITPDCKRPSRHMDVKPVVAVTSSSAEDEATGPPQANAWRSRKRLGKGGLHQW